MKKLTVILCLLLAVCIKASAQDALYIVDGQVVTNIDVKPADILTTNIIDSAKLAASNLRAYKYGMTVIVTKQGGVKAYQHIFSDINKKYKDYIDQKHGDDSNLAYVLNNTILNQQKKSAILQLYQLKTDSIKSINFKKDSHFTTDATVVITTKE